ncbi:MULTISPECIES: hypothetical protein [Stutzerimonas]|uniref:hypothetical protein n=1 Tax=Stutzerimonas TaxID=2901164 RepID=UPI0028B173FF|nr:hypothetical protein [Stutzerimonas kunmingensis]
MLGLFRRRFDRDSLHTGYITIVYPRKGKGVVIHDSLNAINSKAATPSGQPVEQFEMFPIFDEPTTTINPATGLLMVDEFIDVGGNPFGFGD